MPFAGNGRRPEKMGQPAPTYAFVSSDTDDARKAAARLTAIYGQHGFSHADVVVALGGDGFLLHTLRETMGTGRALYGMNRGTVGFLMNEFREQGLTTMRRRSPRPYGRWRCKTSPRAAMKHALAVNEVSLFRQTYQAAKIGSRSTAKCGSTN